LHKIFNDYRVFILNIIQQYNTIISTDIAILMIISIKIAIKNYLSGSINMEEILFNGKFKGFRTERIRRDKYYSMSINHFHSYYEIYYLLSGQRYYFIGSRNYYVKKGDLVIVDSNQIHRTSNFGDAGHERILLEFDPSLLEHINLFIKEGFIETNVFRNSGVLNLDKEEQVKIEALLNNIIDEMKNQKSGYKGMVIAKLIELFTFIIRKMENTEYSNSFNKSRIRANHKIEEIADFISSHYSENISIEDLSEKFYMSKYHLCRTFKKYTGFTINEYININRIMQAKKLLTDSNISISKIAEQTGYQSLTNFGKVFKQYMGKRPTDFRKAYRIR